MVQWQRVGYWVGGVVGRRWGGGGAVGYRTSSGINWPIFTRAVDLHVMLIATRVIALTLKVSALRLAFFL